MDILDKAELPENGKRLEDVLADGYEFDFGDYLGKGFALFGKEAGNLIGFTLVFFVINIIASFLFDAIGIPFLDTAFSLTVGTALGVGIYTFMIARDNDYGVSFNNFFDGFKQPYFGRLIVANLIQGILSTIVFVLCFIPFFSNYGMELIDRISGISNTTDPDEILELARFFLTGEVLWTLIISVVLSLILTTIWIYTPLFILKRNMGFWEAMEASRKIVSKKFFAFFGLMLFLILLLTIGAFLCGLGLLVAYPVFFLTIYYSFGQIMEEPTRM